ncbi:hypothetical protein EJ02DRAFT_512365 [Clathrospora elynae]|uniref:Uncharacterized protein n=1 Tax=Clathrospora elynae TaxID=706981 RepID=A0A6A5SX36_9PLEO|nr:hypothetical protein EJ02DRAFT_512365 [Clathrospora elynae]
MEPTHYAGAPGINSQVADNTVSWCCSRGRLFTIWITLCGFDLLYCRRKVEETSKSSKNRPIASVSGVGYGSGGRYGRGGFGYADGFGSMGRNRVEPDDPRETKAEKSEKRTDNYDRVFLSFLAVLCPSPGNDQNDMAPLSRFDVQPPKAVTSMLVNSKVMKKVAELLRNDSLDHARQRKDLYMALINFLKRVSVHPVSKQ